MISTTSPTPFPVRERDILHSDTTRYLIVDFKGEGCFGKVAQCLDLIKGNMVAVKIHKTIQDHVIEEEVTMLEKIRAIDPDQKNIVTFMEHFRYNNLSCLAFEMLDKSLWDLMKERNWERLSVNEIRPVTHQLLVAFEALKEIGVMHTDLKPDNVMLINHKDQPFKIKLIDFGLARPANQAEIGTVMQAKAYRAPEVVLGYSLSESVDMWGVGCIMAYLYFGGHLFPSCPYDWMRACLKLLKPDVHLLVSGIYSCQYFTMDINQRWRLWTPEEYATLTGNKPKVGRLTLDFALDLEDAVRRYPARNDEREYEDRMAFLDLMKCCLHPDGNLRITPSEALEHRFVTMAHLVDLLETDTYMDSALEFMTVSTLHLDESCNDTSCNESEHQAEEPLADSCSAHTDGSSGCSKSSSEVEADLDTKTTSQPATSSNHVDPSCPRSTSKDESKKPHGLLQTTDLCDGVGDKCTPPKEEPDTTALEIVLAGGAAVSVSASDRAAVANTDSSSDEDELSQSYSSTSKDRSKERLRPVPTTDLCYGVEAMSIPPKEEPGTTAFDIVSTGGPAASICSSDGAAASISCHEPDTVPTEPVQVRRKTLFRRIGKFFSRMRKLFRG